MNPTERMRRTYWRCFFTAHSISNSVSNAIESHCSPLPPAILPFRSHPKSLNSPNVTWLDRFSFPWITMCSSPYGVLSHPNLLVSNGIFMWLLLIICLYPSVTPNFPYTRIIIFGQETAIDNRISSFTLHWGAKTVWKNKTVGNPITLTIWLSRLKDDSAAFRLHSEGGFQCLDFRFSVELIFIKFKNTKWNS